MFNKISDTIKKAGKIIEQELKKENKKVISIQDVLRIVLRTESPEELKEKLSKYANSKQLLKFYKPIVRYPFYEVLNKYKELGIDIEYIKGNYIVFAENKLSKSEKHDIMDIMSNESKTKKAVIDDDIVRIIRLDLNDDEIIELVNFKYRDTKWYP